MSTTTITVTYVIAGDLSATLKSGAIGGAKAIAAAFDDSPVRVTVATEGPVNGRVREFERAFTDEGGF